MGITNETVRIYVGADRSQLLACRVLEYSIRRHTTLPVVLTPMIDLRLPQPRDPRQRARTGFSFARFAIPRLAGYQGRALYLDADMLVFRDIAQLWHLPFNGAKVLIQSGIAEDIVSRTKKGAPGRRIKQTAVMLINCEDCRWVPEDIIAGLDTHYTYEELQYDLCILRESGIGYMIPPQWNSLELFDGSTCLLHFTDMPTQPWVSLDNPNGYLWVGELRRMLEEQQISEEEIAQEVQHGHVRPSLLEELRIVASAGQLAPESSARLVAMDSSAGFVPHRALRRELKARQMQRQKNRWWSHMFESVASPLRRWRPPTGQ